MNDRTSRSAACCASVGTLKCRPCFDARVHCGRTGQSRQSEALNRIETYGLRSASVYSFHPMLNRPRGQRAHFCPPVDREVLAVLPNDRSTTQRRGSRIHSRFASANNTL